MHYRVNKFGLRNIDKERIVKLTKLDSFNFLESLKSKFVFKIMNNEEDRPKKQIDKQITDHFVIFFTLIFLCKQAEVAMNFSNKNNHKNTNSTLFVVNLRDAFIVFAKT